MLEPGPDAFGELFDLLLQTLGQFYELGGILDGLVMIGLQDLVLLQLSIWEPDLGGFPRLVLAFGPLLRK